MAHSPTELNIPSQYVSLDAKDGELTLALSGDAQFLLALSLWDKTAESQTARQVVSGTWEVADQRLVLHGNSCRLVYQSAMLSVTVGRHDAEAAAWQWVESDRATFADGLTLLDRQVVEDILSRSTPENRE